MSIKSSFDYASNYIKVHGSNMHYIEQGQGDPILFLHGNPTSSYLWRNIIPYVSDAGRCIAPDLIGMGKSDKPDIAYRFQDHARYISAFIEQMNLDKIILVLHDWGSGIGFDYAMAHPDKIKGIAFMEGFVKPKLWSEFPSDFKLAFKLMRMPMVGGIMIQGFNFFINVILPKAIKRSLSKAEKAAYKAPFPTMASLKPVRQWPREIPIDGEPKDMHALVAHYSEKLIQSNVPKLLLYATPGGLIDPATLAWCQSHLKNLRCQHIGESIHYVQEDCPEAIGHGLAQWLHDLENQ